MKLFDIPETQKPNRKERCKTCLHIEIIEYRSGKRFFYCSIRKSKMTMNGLMKIKHNNEACDAYIANN